MNEKIINHYESIIESNLEYLANHNVRSSLETYKKMLWKETEQLKDENLKRINFNYIQLYYEDSISILERDEQKINKVVSRTIAHFANLDRAEIIELIHTQIAESLSKFELTEKYDSFNGLFFEFDTDYYYVGIGFKEKKFEVILNPPEYVKFENGDYATELPLGFELKNIGEILNDAEYDKIARDFEYELDIFQKIKETYNSLVAICLNKAISTTGLKEHLELKGFEKNGVIYLNEHDMENKTVYVNEN